MSDHPDVIYMQFGTKDEPNVEPTWCDERVESSDVIYRRNGPTSEIIARLTRERDEARAQAAEQAKRIDQVLEVLLRLPDPDFDDPDDVEQLAGDRDEAVEILRRATI